MIDIEADVTGQPVGARGETRTHWAVLVDCPIRDVPGPHLLGSESVEGHARQRLWWWQEKRPDANPRLVRQKVVTTYGPWVVAEDQTAEPIAGQP